jgi:hypothetical protein
MFAQGFSFVFLRVFRRYPSFPQPHDVPLKREFFYKRKEYFLISTSKHTAASNKQKQCTFKTLS